jgi:hypothetical protein
MANALYTSYKVLLLNPGTLGTTSATAVDLVDDTIKVALIDTGTYTFSAAHDFYDDVSSAVVGTPQTLASKTVTGGVFDAADVTFTALSGGTVEAYVIYKDTGTPSTSPLIGYFDSVASGLPLTPNGGNVTLAFDNGANKIFAL